MDFVDPIAELGPHVAPLGIEFYDGKTFPKNTITTYLLLFMDHGTNIMENLAIK